MLNLPLKSAANHVLSQKLSHVPPEKPSPGPREERIEINPKTIPFNSKIKINFYLK